MDGNPEASRVATQHEEGGQGCVSTGSDVGIIHHKKFQSSSCNCLSIELTSPTHYNEFFKNLVFHIFSFVIATHLTAILLPESLHDKNIDSIVGFWFNVPLQ